MEKIKNLDNPFHDPERRLKIKLVGVPMGGAVRNFLGKKKSERNASRCYAGCWCRI